MAEFKQIKENLNALNISADSPIYDYADYHSLVDAARRVRGISVFSGYTTPVYSSLRPFHYQETAVQTMLIDFEGRGVFGDQVGLGKTIEALMTAHIMFRQREIRNMLVVCPPNLVAQWASEISTKFRDIGGKCVFDIKLEKDKTGNWSLKNSVRELKEQIKAQSDTVTDRLPVFFLSTTSLTALANMEEESRLSQELHNVEEKIGKANERLEELKYLRDCACDKSRMSLDEKRKYDAAVVASELSGRPIEETFVKLRDAISNIAKQEQLIRTLKEQYEAQKQDSLWEMPIDLLVVDEADTVVSGAVSKLNAKKDVEKAELLLKSLTNLRKKYCILVSATPLRAQLEDIYYLVKIVDENRFASLDAFYTYVGAHSLAELVENEELLKRLTGLINTMFTRARMHDRHVKESYPPEEGCTLERVISALRGYESDAKQIWSHPGYPVLTKSEIDRRLALLRSFVENSIRVFCETFTPDPLPFGKELVDKVYRNINGNAYYKKIVMRGMRDYYLATQDVFIHRYIDWSRLLKEGHPHNVEGDDALQNEQILESLGEIGKRGDQKVVIFEGKTGKSKQKDGEAEESNNRLTLYEQLKNAFPVRKIFADIDAPSFWKKVGCKIETGDLDDYEDGSYDEDETAQDTPKGKEGLQYKAFKRWNLREFSRPEPDYADAIYLIDQTRREGTNLNCASRLIICQITGFGGLLDPLRFEQIIGRLNRVGQLDNIIIDVYVDNDRELELYNLYADENGLDMVKNGKPEVSFIIPIVTELFRAKRKKDARYRELKKDASFINVFNYCYDNRARGCLTELKNEIRKLCSVLMVRNVQEDI